MHTDFSRFDHVHLMGDSAMHPIAPRLTHHAALGWACQRPGDALRLVGRSLLRCLPCRARLSRSLSPFALSTGTQAPVEPRRSPLPAHRFTAQSDASNCRFQVELWLEGGRLITLLQKAGGTGSLEVGQAHQDEQAQKALDQRAQHTGVSHFLDQVALPETRKQLAVYLWRAHMDAEACPLSCPCAWRLDKAMRSSNGLLTIYCS